MPLRSLSEAYQVLEIHTSATESEIKSSYKRLALKTHPDKNLNDPQASAKFQQVTDAFQMIMGKVSGDSFQRNGAFGGRFRYEGDSSAGSEDGEEYDDEDFEDMFYEEQLARELFNFIFSNKEGSFAFKYTGMKQGPCQCVRCIQLRREQRDREEYRAAQQAQAQRTPKAAAPVRPPNFDPHAHWLSDDEDDGVNKRARTAGSNKSSKKQSKRKKGKQKGKKSSSARKKALPEQHSKKASESSSSDESDSDDQSDSESGSDIGSCGEVPTPMTAKAKASVGKQTIPPAKQAAGQQQAAKYTQQQKGKPALTSPQSEPSASSATAPLRTPSVYPQSSTPVSSKSASSFYTTSSAQTTPASATTTSAGSNRSTPSGATSTSAHTTPRTPSTLRSTPGTGRSSVSAGSTSAGSARSRSESATSTSGRGAGYEHTVAALSSGQGSPRISPDRGKHTGAQSSSATISTTMPKLEGVQLCRTFLTKHGNCKYGDSCRFSHGGAPGTVAAGQTPLQEASVPGAPRSPVRTSKSQQGTPKKGHAAHHKSPNTAATGATATSSPAAGQRKAHPPAHTSAAAAIAAAQLTQRASAAASVSGAQSAEPNRSNGVKGAETAEQGQQRVCAFYGTEKGCRYGDKCRFQHKDA